MRLLLLSLLLAVAGISTAWADPRSFHAGIARIKVQDTTPFDAVIVYPTEAAEVDAPVAAGARFPVVLFSHGGGRGRGHRWFIAIFCFTSRGKGSSSSRRSIPQARSLSSIGRDTFTRRSMLRWPIHALPNTPIATGSAWWGSLSAAR